MRNYIFDGAPSKVNDTILMPVSSNTDNKKSLKIFGFQLKNESGSIKQAISMYH